MKFSARRDIIFTGLFLSSLLSLIRLGAVELQPWDEGLYALRAKSIIVFGSFLDQAQYAAGGLYSAVYPPLAIWFMALFLKVFGTDSVFALRLYSVICGGISIFLTYFIARQLVSRQLAFITGLLLAGTTIWNIYSRQAMMDVPLLMWALFSLLAIIKVIGDSGQKQVGLWAGMYALSLAACLMTKIVFSFLPLLLLLPVFFDKQVTGTTKKILSMAAIIGIAIALPWHIFMAFRHGQEFLNYFFVPYLYEATENNTRALGFFYYPNQLLVTQPFVIFTVIFLGFYFLKKLMLPSRSAVLENIVVVWFVAVFVALSAGATKMPNYTLYLVPPALFMAARGIEELSARIRSFRIVWTIAMLLLLLCLWSFFPEIRVSLQSIFKAEKDPFAGVGFVSVSVLLIISGWFLPSAILSKVTPRVFFKIVVVLPFVFLLRIAYLNYTEPNRTYANVAAVGEFLKSSGADSFTYVFHRRNEADAYNPQLSWYTDGWLAGWQPGKIYSPVGIDSVSADQLLKLDPPHERLTVYYRNLNDKNGDSLVMNALQKSRTEVFKTRQYIVYKTDSR